MSAVHNEKSYLDDNSRKALAMLARKANPTFKFQNENQWISLKNDRFYCLICNIKITNQNVTLDVHPKLHEHGLIHLKERNLLAFI